MSGLVVDLFAGGGGASTGIEAALGRSVDIAINHDPTALAVHRANHPKTQHLEADIWEVRPREAVRGRPVDLLWASPDCTHFSVAKGATPRAQGIRSLAWVVTRWAREVRPGIILLENVAEFAGWGPLGPDGQPDKKRKGETFQRWLARLRGLGYSVEHRVLDASQYGAPTRRRRLFLVARCDGLPIVWPEATHGPGRLALRTAAECIDWSLRCPSIFERKRPLAEKTLWRIAQGIRRFVLQNPRPFLVEMNHSNRPRDVVSPLGVVTTQRNRFQLVSPVIAGVGGRAGQSAAIAADRPLGVVTAKNDRALVAPHLVKIRHDSIGASVDAPAPTITAGGGNQSRTAGAGHALGVAVAHLSRQFGRGVGSQVSAPAPTVMPGGSGKSALVAAFLAKHYGDRGQRPGLDLAEPVATITASDHHALAAATLVKMRGDCGGSGVDEPAPTITASGTHLAEVRAFLTAYYGNDGSKGQGQGVLEPLRTVTTRARLGLVTVEGTEYQIVDIGMRMLEPQELLRAQFGEFAASYDLSAARTKAAKVRLIGNSVAPEIAAALVCANYREYGPEAELPLEAAG